MHDTGNDVQVRKVAEQLFDTWKTQQELEAKARRRWFGSNVGGWIAAMVVILSSVAAVANTYDLAVDANARSLRNESNIGAMKADNSDRLARIETKIDLMMEERKK